MSFESSSHDNLPSRTTKLHPDPIRAPPRLTQSPLTQTHSSKLAGYGPHRSCRHLHHQSAGVVGTFHVRLLEGRQLQRRHWSALSLGPVKHLGLSRAHGEVSSFGTLRLAFYDGKSVSERSNHCRNDCDEHDNNDDDMKQSMNMEMDESSSMLPKIPIKSNDSSEKVASSSLAANSTAAAGSTTPLTPFDHHGSLRSSTAMSMTQFRSQTTQQQQQQRDQVEPPLPPSQHRNTTPKIKNFASPKRNHAKQSQAPTTATSTSVDSNFAHPFPPLVPSNTTTQSSKSAVEKSKFNNKHYHFHNQHTPHHYAKEVFKSSTVPNDSNPVWGDNTTTNTNSNNNNNNNNNIDSNTNQSNFQIPLHKDDLLPTTQTDGVKITLHIRLDEEMAPTESLLVNGALSSAVNVASVATSVVGMGKQTKDVSNMGREILGLGSDRLIGRGVVDLMPLLVGVWEEEWDGNVLEEEKEVCLDVEGRIPVNARGMRRRVERMGLLDVWVPLIHPSDEVGGNKRKGDDSNAGKVHLLISYEPNGMTPKRDDVVALESFARRPFDQMNGDGSVGRGSNNNDSSFNGGSVIHPILPTLSPFLVIDMKGSYLLLEYATSRTVTSVDRLGNIKSSRWERTHRVRIHRNSVFVIERRTLLDVAGNIARLPGDIVLSTSVGQEIAEASAPLVAGALELVTPAWQGAKLLVGAGSLGVKASLAGAKAASSAVVTVSQQKAMERREGVYVDERDSGDSGVYRYVS